MENIALGFEAFVLFNRFSRLYFWFAIH